MAPATARRPRRSPQARAQAGGTARTWRLAGVLAAWLALAAAAPAWAQPAAAALPQVALSGTMGTRAALLVIDGQPQTLAVGATARGVTLRRVADGEAEVSIGEQRLRLRMGGLPVALGGPVAGDSGQEIVLPVGPGGHYLAQGLVNGRPLPFLVDTGATTVTLSAAMANALGLDWQRAPRAQARTANGTVTVAEVVLTSLRIGDVTVTNVPATVVPADLPQALLGNSFLGRFNLRRDADTLRLTRR